MKKTLFLLSAVCAMTFAACGSSQNSDESGDTTGVDTTMMMEDPTMGADTSSVDTMGMADTTTMDTTTTMR